MPVPSREMSFAWTTQFRAPAGGKLTLANPEKVILALRFWQTRSTLRAINGLLALIKAHCGFLRNISLPFVLIQILVHHS